MFYFNTEPGQKWNKNVLARVTNDSGSGLKLLK